MSFSSPQPTKAARPLARSASYISLVDPHHFYSQPRAGPSSHKHDSVSLQAYTRLPRQPTKEPRERRKSSPRNCSSDRITLQPKTTRPSSPTPAPAPMSGLRTPSPLAPAPLRAVPAARTHFPRSKPEPDLYRVAITTRMRKSPEGQKILHMGPRLAFSIYNATRELEKLVASQTQRDAEGDVDMADSGDMLLTSSWVAVARDDWEMIDCAA
ncbi:hypothetical protein PsYK624_127620 [Phanerochaete sordida]|uniref:Uncharacterized protein n=1 Tax=Phanerochaete sordida TaxID=48140 RepID=A0A9P3LJD4_9APHY|nr:hypothetical protein PsYK624_127620 [Phanerochaete sordida]